MKIHGLVCSVNYADFLALGIGRWASALESITVVTDLKDDETVRVSEAHGAAVHRTGVFYERGAVFNKGAALEEARQRMPWRDWCLFFDADIVPGWDWYERLRAFKPQPGKLYSARRRECLNPADVDREGLPVIKTDGIGVGYFQLFHTSDPKAQDVPLLETCWSHAGVYDCAFMHRWAPDERVEVKGLRLTHVGERDNWLGRGNKEGFAALMEERKRRGGYEHERIQ